MKKLLLPIALGCALIGAVSAYAEITNISTYFPTDATLSSGNTIPVRVKCTSDLIDSESCSGTVTVTATIDGKSTEVGSGSFFHAAGETAETEITLSSEALDALKQGDLKITACAESSQLPSTSCDSLTLSGSGSNGSNGSTPDTNATDGGISLAIGSKVKVKGGRFKLKLKNEGTSDFSGVLEVTAKLGGQFGSGYTRIVYVKVSVAAGKSAAKKYPLTSAVRQLLKQKGKFSAKACVGTSTSDAVCKNFKLVR